MIAFPADVGTGAWRLGLVSAPAVVRSELLMAVRSPRLLTTTERLFSQSVPDHRIYSGTMLGSMVSFGQEAIASWVASAGLTDGVIPQTYGSARSFSIIDNGVVIGTGFYVGDRVVRISGDVQLAPGYKGE